MTVANGRRRLDLRSAGLRNFSYGSWLRENSEIELSSTALGRVRARSVHPLTADIAVLLRQVRFVPKHNVAAIAIGGSLAAPPLPHHRAYGSVHGGSRSCANTIG